MTNVPEYRKVRQYVLDGIMDHEDAGERIASERELAVRLNVSRRTVRYALSELIADGYLFVKKGLGMFVDPKHLVRHYGSSGRKLGEGCF